MRPEILKKQRAFTDLDLTITRLGILASSIDMSQLSDYKIPEQVRDEIPTLNQYGYMKTEFEYFSETFVSVAETSTKPVLEIGTAYGWLTHKILEVGADVVALDISKEHLEILVKEAPKQYLDNLYIYHGSFPDETDFENNSFDAIMMSRIMHFLKGDSIEKGLDKVHDWLTQNGTLVATNCSIYHSCVKGKMTDEFQRRIDRKELWPGMAMNSDFNTGHNNCSEGFLNTFYKEQLEALLPKHGFRMEKIEYFDYPSDTWPDNNMGHIGFVATKI